jgi:cytoskeleton protein RodZ
MSESVSEDGIVVAAAGASGQAGSLLKRAREAQGLHIGALAVALKVPVKKLEALEAGRFEELPDMVFVRSFTLSVCRALRIDPEPIMASLPERVLSQFKANDNGLNTSFKDSAGPSHHAWLSQLSSPLGWAVLALVLAIVVILAWPASPLFEERASPPGNPDPAVLTSLPQDAQPALETQPLPDASSAAPALPATSASMMLPVATGSAAKPGAVAPASAPASTVLAAVAPDAASGPVVLELTGHGESWVQVTDASGQTKLRKTIHSGEIIRVGGPLPLSVTVGRADQVSASVRGQTMDLSPLARDNVARFEVK